MGCEEFRPQECLLSLASKAHLLVFSGTGFCLHEEAPPPLQCELGTSGLAGPPLSAPSVHTALPGPPAHPLGKHTGLGFPLGGRSCWETPALSPGRKRKLLCLGDWAVPWRQACYCKQSRQVQVKPYPGRALGMKVKKTS